MSTSADRPADKAEIVIMPTDSDGEPLWQCGDTMDNGETYFCSDCDYGVEADYDDEED